MRSISSSKPGVIPTRTCYSNHYFHVAFLETSVAVASWGSISIKHTVHQYPIYCNLRKLQLHVTPGKIKMETLHQCP